MTRLLKKWFQRELESEIVGDIAEGDWSPVPPGQLALPRVSPPPPPPVLSAWAQVMRQVGEHLTDEELLIVREQLAS